MLGPFFFGGVSQVIIQHLFPCSHVSADLSNICCIEMEMTICKGAVEGAIHRIVHQGIWDLVFIDCQLCLVNLISNGISTIATMIGKSCNTCIYNMCFPAIVFIWKAIAIKIVRKRSPRGRTVIYHVVNNFCSSRHTHH